MAPSFRNPDSQPAKAIGSIVSKDNAVAALFPCFRQNDNTCRFGIDQVSFCKLLELLKRNGGIIGIESPAPIKLLGIAKRVGEYAVEPVSICPAIILDAGQDRFQRSFEVFRTDPVSDHAVDNILDYTGHLSCLVGSHIDVSL